MAAMAILTLFRFLLWEHVQDLLDLVLDTRLLFNRLDMGGVCMPCFFFSFSALNSILLYTTLLCIYLQHVLATPAWYDLDSTNVSKNLYQYKYLTTLQTQRVPYDASI
jgi:hypothetical protein